MYQLRNAVNHTNVTAKPKKDFNACHRLFELVVHCHIIAAALHYLSMDKLDDKPSADKIPDPDNAWMLPKEERQKQLYTICQAIVQQFVSFKYNGDSPRNLRPPSDLIRQYAVHILSLGAFYMEYRDAISEGDGDRILRCWRYLLPIFKGSGRKNYSMEALTLLCQHRYVLSPQLSSQLLWSRTVNTCGLPGRNIPGDLHCEHLNRVAKECIRHLGANKNPKSITRVGKAMGTIAPVLDQFDSINGLKPPSGAHKRPSSEKDRDIILKYLLNNKIFSDVPGRVHSSFQKPRDVLKHENNQNLISWMSERLL